MQIISDFTFAKEHLSATNDKSGTPTQATAAAYLATAAGYALVDDYESIFTVANEGNPELLFYFEFEANKSIGGGQDGNVWIVERMIRNLPAPFKHIIGAADGWGYALPTRNLYDAFESDDPRRGATLYAPGDDYGIYREGDDPLEYVYKIYAGADNTLSNQDSRPTTSFSPFRNTKWTTTLRLQIIIRGINNEYGGDPCGCPFFHKRSLIYCLHKKKYIVNYFAYLCKKLNYGTIF